MIWPTFNILPERGKKAGNTGPGSGHQITFSDTDKEKEVSEEKKSFPQQGNARSQQGVT